VEEPVAVPDEPASTRVIKVGRIDVFGSDAASHSRPLIRLSGKWLQQAGFRIGDTLEVQVRFGKLLLTNRSTVEE